MIARARLSAASRVHGGDVGNGREFANRGIQVNPDHVVEVKGGRWSWKSESRTRHINQAKMKGKVEGQ